MKIVAAAVVGIIAAAASSGGAVTVANIIYMVVATLSAASALYYGFRRSLRSMVEEVAKRVIEERTAVLSDRLDAIDTKTEQVREDVAYLKGRLNGTSRAPSTP